MNPQAEKLNQSLKTENPIFLDFLSQVGQRIFFPSAGILGQTAQAKGKKYNATIGIAKEDDNSPMRLEALDSLVSLSPAQVFPYAPSFGHPEIRKCWKELIFKKNPSLAGREISLPVVTQALTHGLSLAGTLFLDPGEEILVADPFWGNYTLLFEEVLGAKIKTFPCFTENGGFDLEALKASLAQGADKQVVLLNFPNNPTGYTPTVSECAAICKVLTDSAESGKKLVVILDDAYFGLVYEEGIAQESLFANLTHASSNLLAVKIDGATKEDYVWGLRVGFITYGIKDGTEALYKALADKTGGVIRGAISNCSNLSQSLMLKAYKDKNYETQKLEKYKILKNRFEVLRDELKNHSEYSQVFSALPFNSGYFMCVKPIDGIDAEKLRHLLLEKYDTGIINQKGLIRIAFSALPASDIPAILNNIYLACLELKA